MEQSFGITAERLEKARGKMIAASGQGISWKQLATMSNISQNTFSNILNGRTNGSIRTARKLMAVAPKFNTVLELSDLITPL